MIYIIDDDQNVRDGYMILFKSAGYECNCFESAEKFLENYQAGVHDLLLLDIQLTEMDGVSFLEYLISNGIHIPVIVITAHDDKVSRESAKKYGAIAYLRKPVDGTALIDLIKYKLDSVTPKIKLSI